MDMEPASRDMRRAAARSFFESLDKLQKTLDEKAATNEKLEPVTGHGSPSNAEKKGPPVFDLSDLEDAVADIEQFFQSRNSKPTDSKD